MTVVVTVTVTKMMMMMMMMRTAGGSSNDSSVYRMSAAELTTNDAQYHRIRLTRRATNVTLSVDDMTHHQLTGKHCAPLVTVTPF